MAAPNVLIAASGTGGHLFPALFIAQAIKAQAPGAIVEFAGSGRALEGEIIDKAGFKRHVIGTVGLKRRGVRGLFEFALTFPRALLQTREIFRSLRPDVVIGVGGYVTFFPVVWARLFGVPTIIHEAELKPGLATQVLSLVAGRITYSFEEAGVSGKRHAIFTGHPVREELKSAALQLSGEGSAPSSEPKKILVLGGSQGAEGLDRAFNELAPKLAQRGMALYHQSRPENVDKLIESYRAAKLDSQVVPFVRDMSGAYGWADIVVCRAGAGTVMEIGVINKPAIFVPYPYAQGDHQSANAQTLVRPGKALLVDERPGRDSFDQSQTFPGRLWSAIEILLDRQQYQAMALRPYSGRKLDGAQRIASLALDLAAGK